MQKSFTQPVFTFIIDLQEIFIQDYFNQKLEYLHHFVVNSPQQSLPEDRIFVVNSKLPAGFWCFAGRKLVPGTRGEKKFFAGSLWVNPGLCVASYFQPDPISTKKHLTCFPEIEKILIKIAGIPISV